MNKLFMTIPMKPIPRTLMKTTSSRTTRQDYGKVDMAEVFPNTDDNPIEYIYARDSTGRVISVDFHLKVPRNEVEFIRSHDENGGIVDVECRFKKTGEDDTTGN